MKLNSIFWVRLLLVIMALTFSGITIYFGAKCFNSYFRSSLIIDCPGRNGGAVGAGIIAGCCIISFTITFLIGNKK